MHAMIKEVNQEQIVEPWLTFVKCLGKYIFPPLLSKVVAVAQRQQFDRYQLP